jgi:hypothetical protein
MFYKTKQQSCLILEQKCINICRNIKNRNYFLSDFLFIISFCLGDFDLFFKVRIKRINEKASFKSIFINKHYKKLCLIKLSIICYFYY